MTKEEFDAIIKRLLQEGIQITLSIGENDNVVYDLNTGMKSGMKIWHNTDVNRCYFAQRYDRNGMLEDWGDLLNNVKYCMHGRDFGDCDWLSLLEREGYLTKVVTTTVSYK